MTVMSKTFAVFCNFISLLLIFMFILTVMGLQLFCVSYRSKANALPNKEMTKWNFLDFSHSFMMVFRIICGDWFQSWQHCATVAENSVLCGTYFLAAFIVGRLCVLAMCLVLIISSFGATVDVQNENLSEAFVTIWKNLMRAANSLMCLLKPMIDILSNTHAHLVQRIATFSWTRWTRFILKSVWLFEHKYYESVVSVFILFNSITIAMDVEFLRGKSVMNNIAFYFEGIYIFFLFIELVMKFLSFGLMHAKEIWCILELVSAPDVFPGIN